MSLFYNPLKMLCVEYNHHRGTTFTPEDVRIEKIVDLGEFAGNRIDKKNTMVLATVNGEETRFFYNRIDLVKDFARMFPLGDATKNTLHRLVLDADCNGSTKTLARAISRAYGLPITEIDIVDEPFNPPTTTTVMTVKITFSKESLLFIPGSTGSFVIDEVYRVISGKTYMLKEFSRLPEAFYEDHQARGRTAYKRISLLTYGKDYSPIAHLLKRLVGNPVYSQQESIGYQPDAGEFGVFLAQAMSQCDGIDWTCLKLTSGYSLYGAQVIYNGPVSECKKSLASTDKIPTHLVRLMAYGNLDFDNVAVLLLSTTQTGATQYGAVLHYNNP